MVVHPLNCGPFLTFCNFMINLGLSNYDILSLLTQLLYNSGIIGLIQLLIVCGGDIEVNPGPKNKSQLSLCHWNLNGLTTHNFIKVSLL